jgi:hypothetical protein
MGTTRLGGLAGQQVQRPRRSMALPTPSNSWTVSQTRASRTIPRPSPSPRAADTARGPCVESRVPLPERRATSPRLPTMPAVIAAPAHPPAPPNSTIVPYTTKSRPRTASVFPSVDPLRLQFGGVDLLTYGPGRHERLRAPRQTPAMEGRSRLPGEPGGPIGSNTGGARTGRRQDQHQGKRFRKRRFGDVAQLVRVPDCRSGGCGFDSRRPRLKGPLTRVVSGSFVFGRSYCRAFRSATLSVLSSNWSAPRSCRHAMAVHSGTTRIMGCFLPGLRRKLNGSGGLKPSHHSALRRSLPRLRRAFLLALGGLQERTGPPRTDRRKTCRGGRSPRERRSRSRSCRRQAGSRECSLSMRPSRGGYRRTGTSKSSVWVSSEIRTCVL